MSLFWVLAILAVLFVVFNGKKSDSWKNDPASERQLEFLADLGYTGTKQLTKGRASELIEEYKARR